MCTAQFVRFVPFVFIRTHWTYALFDRRGHDDLNTECTEPTEHTERIADHRYGDSRDHLLFCNNSLLINSTGEHDGV